MALIDADGLNTIQLAQALMLTRRYVRQLIGNLTHEGVIEKSMGGTTTARGGNPTQYVVTDHGKQLLEKNDAN